MLCRRWARIQHISHQLFRLREKEAQLEFAQAFIIMNHDNNNQVTEVSVSVSITVSPEDDGRTRKTGTMIRAGAYIMSTMIGPAGVVTLPWALAQLGWISGMIAFALFSLAAYCTFSVQATGGGGMKSCTYTDVVKADLGEAHVKMYVALRFLNRFGMAIGYTILSSTSMMAIQRSICYHSHGHNTSCQVSSNPYMIAFGLIQIVLSQYQNFDQIQGISIVSAVMPVAYSAIGLGLEIAKVAEKKTIEGSSTGVRIGVVTETQKIWKTLLALGVINFVYSYTLSLIEIQETIKSPASENEEMKKVGLRCVSVTSVVKILCGIFGYAAFGDASPENLLTGFGFYEPYWLVDIANAAVVIHLVVAYQLFCQPLFASVEETVQEVFPNSKFIPKPYGFDMFRFVWRSVFVILVTAVSMLVPFFNYVVGILGVLRFWPLTVYFPVRIYIAQNAIPRWSSRWFGLHFLNVAALVVSVAAAVASVAGIVSHL